MRHERFCQSEDCSQRRWGERVQLSEGRPRPEGQLSASQGVRQAWNQSRPRRPSGGRKVCGAQGLVCSCEVVFSKSQCPSEWPSLSVPGSGAPATGGREEGNRQNKDSHESD